MPRPAAMTAAAIVVVAAGMLAGCTKAAPPLTRAERAQQRWLKRHEDFSTRAKQGNMDILFLGDSITEYWQTDGRAIWETEFAKWRVGNFGIAGDSTHGLLWRVQNGELEGIKPKAVVLLIGTNDVSAGLEPPNVIADNVAAIVSQIKSRLPDSKILLLAVFPRGEHRYDPARLAVTAVNEKIAALDDGKTVRFLDLGDAFVAADGSVSPELMPDYLHLSENGYRLWAQRMKPVLAELMS